MKRRDFERTLKNEGYQIIRSNGHITWGNPGGHTVAVPHGKEINDMIVRRLMKTIEQFKTSAKAPKGV